MNPLYRNLCWFSVLAWVITIHIFSSMSGPQVEELNVFELWDKAAHFIAFAAGGFLLANALKQSTAWPWKKLLWVTMLSIALYGAIDETHQLFTPNRSGADVADWLADALGGIAGACLLSFIYVRCQCKKTPPGN